MELRQIEGRMSSRLYVKVLDAKCCAYTTCAEVAPKIFKLDENGFAYVENALVPEGLEEDARKGARSCPQDAIVLSEEPFPD